MIEVKNLKKYYNYGKIKAVDDISFEIKEGEIYGFLGPNGAGKTTTIRCLLGMLNKDEGEIIIDGEQVSITDISYKNKIGYLPGELGLPFGLTANKLFKYVSKLYDIEPDWVEVDRLAKLFQLDMTRPVNNLSKGNKQKVGLVIALMNNFKILILDEPTSGLDPLMQQTFYKILREKNAKTKCTVFFCSHNLSEVDNICDRVAIIRKGKIIEISDIHELKQKNIKEFEITTETPVGLEEIQQFMTEKYKTVKMEQKEHTQTLKLLVPNSVHISLLTDLTGKQWGGSPLKDILIQNSSLEHVFLEFYKEDLPEEDVKGGASLTIGAE
jgi:beta-exotoxin I transport system ATP-binding protein